MNYSDWYWLYAYERSYCSPAVHSAITQRLRDGDQGQKYPIPAGTIEGGTFIETIVGQIWWRVYPGGAKHYTWKAKNGLHQGMKEIE
jgi:hypothetical protein